MVYTGEMCREFLKYSEGGFYDRPPAGKQFAVAPGRFRDIVGIEYLTPMGFDVTVGGCMWVSDLLSPDFRDVIEAGAKPIPLWDNPVVLEPDTQGRKIYYIQSKEKVEIPGDLEVIIDAKSTTGRLGAMCHQVANYYTPTSLLMGESGKELMFAIQPYAFPLMVKSGETQLGHGIVREMGTPFMTPGEIIDSGQVRVYIGDDELDLRDVVDKDGLGLTFSTLDVFVAKDNCPPLDMAARGTVDWRDYFERQKDNDSFVIEPDRFYLLGTRERVALGSVCARISREHPRSGTGLWGHFAGWVNNGFDGGVTMEVRSNTKRIIHNGDPAGFAIFDRVIGMERTGYSGSYQNQKVPCLPKQFKEVA